jgi:ABC-type lipoprotein release transport system permease subunit
MIWKTAWKNVWRNRMRSLVVIASVTIGVCAAIFSVALMNGMIAQRVGSALDVEISHIQITGKSFRLNNDPEILIGNSKSVISKISTTSGISGFVERTIINGMAGTATKSVGVQIVGIDPAAEKNIFTLYKTIMPGTGNYFEKESNIDLALIGQDLAKELNIVRFIVDSIVLENLKKKEVPEEILQKISSQSGVRFPNEKKFNRTINSLLSKREISKYGQTIKKEAWSFREGSRLTLTFLDKNNNQVGARFRVVGIYDIKNSMLEMSTIFVKNTDIKRLTGIDSSSFHQIIIRIDEVDKTEKITEELRANMPGLEILNWKEIQPDLAMLTDYVHQIYGFLMAIILAALAFGIVNTMLMVVLERTKELGMLTAIGMNKKKVFSMIMLESVFLSLFGGVAGMFTGWIIILLSARNGLNFVKYAEGLEAYGYSAHVYPEISTGFFVMLTLMIILTGILSSIYPALKAIKLNPVEAIRTE